MPNDPRPRRQSLRVIDSDVRLNEIGTIVQQTWDDLPRHYHCIDLDAFIVMPNHVHGIIILADQSERRYGTPEIVRGFKTLSARRVNERAGKRGVLWQRGYYEWIAFALTSRIILRSGRMTLTISRERRLPREGRV